MTVGELIELLRTADASSRVLFLGEYADSDEADEVSEVVIPRDAWTFERGRFEDREFSACYPGPAAEREDGYYTDVTHVSERVVVLSSGPTNLRYDPRVQFQRLD
jgi:hypothetical protein